MKFVQDHLNSHHLRSKPHRWFVAFLASPIHVLELHYKRRYHLSFIHAKKLFFFDVFLVLLMVLLIGLTIFWRTYDPTVTQQVEITLSPITHGDDPTSNRIRAGEHITYQIEYANESDVRLIDPQLTVRMPDDFVWEDAQPEELFDGQTNTYTLPALAPGAAGEVSLTGFFYGEPNKEERVVARLSYSQEDRLAREEKTVSVITILRESFLVGQFDAQAQVLSQGTVPFTFTLTNENHHDIENIRVPFPASALFTFPALASDDGAFDNKTWLIDSLAPDEVVSLSGTLNTQINRASSEATLEITPEIVIADKPIPQSPIVHTFQVLRPNATVSANWDDAVTSVQPGETVSLVAAIENTGPVALEQLELRVLLSNSVIDPGRIAALNPGVLRDGAFVVTSGHNASLLDLQPGETAAIEIQIPIRSRIVNGSDVTFGVQTVLAADVPGISGAEFVTTSESPQIAIGTDVILSAASRYYTLEGDQLGRGPLPPQVGEETKYWAVITLNNASSYIDSPRFTATLPAHVSWTGRSSVSHGNDLSYNESTRVVSWSAPSVSAFAQVGLFMELALVPDASQIGTAPTLLNSIRFTGTDGFTGAELFETTASIDTSIPEDLLGSDKGTVVVE